MHHLNATITTLRRLLPTWSVYLVSIQLLKARAVLRLLLAVFILLNCLYRHVFAILQELMVVLEHAVAFVHYFVWTQFLLNIR